MSIVLVHNHAHPSELEARQARRTKSEVTADHYWNLWKHALKPFHELQDGTTVLLLESWPQGAILSWVATATHVGTGRFPDKKAAVAAIARWAGETPSWVLGDMYTKAKSDDTGVAIYWRAEPVRRIDFPKPPDLHVGRNGWLVTDEAQLAAWGIPVGNSPLSPVTKSAKQPARPRGAGRRLDVEARRAVEDRAMRVAEQWAKSRHWTKINNVSLGNSEGSKSWDLEAVDEHGHERYIEVKGTTGQLGDVEVTEGEVKAAQRHGIAHSLVIVHEIALTMATGKPHATGGIRRVYNPWLPGDEELHVTRYRWRRT